MCDRYDDLYRIIGFFILCSDCKAMQPRKKKENKIQSKSTRNITHTPTMTNRMELTAFD